MVGQQGYDDVESNRSSGVMVSTKDEDGDDNKADNCQSTLVLYESYADMGCASREGLVFAGIRQVQEKEQVGRQQRGGGSSI